MIGSGIGRLIPVRMPPPQPFDYLRRLGELTPMELVWTLVGASPLFQSVTGLATLIGGLLLLFPKTTLLGALICAANLSMAISVSLFYDMPFTPYLSVLLLLAILLIAPDARRLIDLFLLDRPVEPAKDEKASRILPALGLCVIVWNAASAALKVPELYPPKPPYYGAWAVEEGPETWRWVIFQEPGALDVEIGAGTRKRFPTAGLSFAEPEPDVLVVEGQGIRAKLRRMRLSSPWFHWFLGPEEE